MKKALDCVNDYQLESACKDAMYMGGVYFTYMGSKNPWAD